MRSRKDEVETDEGTSGDLSVSRRTVLVTGVLSSGTVVPVTAAPSAVVGRARGGGEGGDRTGERVVDREDPDPDAAVVIAELDVPIADWLVYGHETVADHNPRYDASEPVVVVAFEHRLESAWPDWRRGGPGSLFDGVVERGIKFHAFPRSRLERRRPRGR